MYKKNKLGIYVYPDNVYTINNIRYDVNSISIIEYLNNNNKKFRIINDNIYGIELYKKYRNNVQKK